MQGRFRSRVFINNKQVEDLQTEQTMGCETPKALSSITKFEESAAMKIINQNSLHSGRKT